MGTNIYVGNLPYSETDESLSEAFAQFGTVESSKIIFDRDTGRSKGFGFVEMASAEEADEAINKMNGQQRGGRSLTVNIAHPMESKGPRRGGAGGGKRPNRW